MKHYILTQTQLNRIREICQAGTQAHGDEFFEQIMLVMDELPELPELATSGPTIG